MAEAVLDIKRWGSSLGVRLPASAARAACLNADGCLRLRVENRRMIIEPQGREPLSLAGRLALFDPAVHGGEAMPAAPIGRERG